ncbi:hypothetical protein RSOLAG22IIIB_12471 [Rhizoctonia solani]|uniref:BTB domain-containing protein n=1 Tax=Rhizoctonia solani TaxID=456999 RepID=A0A0K6GEV4_9AGAM|nr:hypothetical protein RSOLAG22IIIB_12471 [Rhizoctonia solani]
MDPTIARGLSFSDAYVPELGSQITSPVLVPTKPGPKASTPPEYEGVDLFEPGDGDIKITVNGTSFESHKYLIKRFQGLKPLLVKRIKPAHEFHLLEWETPAYQELAMRENSITKEEAKAIGLDAFVIIAEMREKEQRRKGELDKRSPTPGLWPSADPGEIPARDNTAGNKPQGNIATKPPPAPMPPSCDAPEEHSAAAHTDNNGVEVGLSLADIKLSGLGLVTSRHGYHAEVPSCQCGSPA